jgi:hypothetical protein
VIDPGSEPRLTPQRTARLDRLIQATRDAPPANLADIIREELHVDLATSYAGCRIPHPFGKGSGQLSCTVPQVAEDAASGVAFVVLKTVIAESADGARSMAPWANPETRMKVERRRSRKGIDGWTVSWKGRGWSGSLDDYLLFFHDALTLAAAHDLLVVPSVKYHLPPVGEEPNEQEYRHTTAALNQVWRRHATRSLILEKDLSPTLAGDTLAGNRALVLHWLSNLTFWIHDAVSDACVGIKVMNAMFDDAFQVEMVRAVMENQRPPDFIVVFNRLFDADRGIAYGGWDLSDRNLAVLERVGGGGLTRMPMSATGNICSGRVMMEYALRGCENGQVHTFFQLPRSQYIASGASRTRCALYTLLLHPRDGLVAWLWTLNEIGVLEERDGVLHFRDVVGRGIR